MVIEKFKIKEIDGYYYISPTSNSVNGKYLIRCEDPEEAKKIKSWLLDGSLIEPHINDDNWMKAHSHINMKTPIYTLGYPI